jgi:hypothetical protein
MPRVPKSRFVNRVALRKAIRGFDDNALKGAYVPPYNRWADDVRKSAKRNAPVKSGRLRGNIKKFIRAKGASRGKTGNVRVARFIIHTEAIQDRLLDRGVPSRRMAKQDLTVRTRNWKGVKHRPSPAGDFTKKDKRRKGKDGKPWAWGYRRPNNFMEKGSNSIEQQKIRQKRVAEEIGTNIRQWIAKEFAKNVGAMR